MGEVYRAMDMRLGREVAVKVILRSHAQDPAFRESFHREARARLGGVHGCTHIVELLGPVATTAFQTVSSRKARELSLEHRIRIGKPPKPADPGAPAAKPYVIDTCHAWAADGPVVKRWAPQFYNGADAEAVRAAAAGKEIEMDG